MQVLGDGEPGGPEMCCQTASRPSFRLSRASHWFPLLAPISFFFNNLIPLMDHLPQQRQDLLKIQIYQHVYKCAMVIRNNWTQNNLSFFSLLWHLLHERKQTVVPQTLLLDSITPCKVFFVPLPLFTFVLFCFYYILF